MTCRGTHIHTHAYIYIYTHRYTHKNIWGEDGAVLCVEAGLWLLLQSGS